MMNSKIIPYTLLAAAALGCAVSCRKEAFEEPAATGDAISFSSFRKQVYTKADLDLLDFAPGTKYTLLAVDSEDYRWQTRKGFATQPQTGTESASHTIEYAPTALFRTGETLDFFGLTYGTDTAPELLTAPSDDETPRVGISETDDRLPDLMHSNSDDAKHRNSAGGTVLLPFEHALSAVNVLISKQDESGDPDAVKQLRNVKVTDITLKNVAETAQMDVVTGAWTWTDGSNASRSRNLFHDEAGRAISEVAGYIGERDLLVVPSAGEQVVLSISLKDLEVYQGGQFVKMTTSNGTVQDGVATIEVPLRDYDAQTGADAGPLDFERNHKYTLAVSVLRDDVRIVAVSPQVYEWQSVDISSQAAVLGQPVTFGGVVWMDRNLGATDYDCENNFLSTMGYYYQFGRNIPFIFDRSVWERFKDNPNVFMPDATQRSDGSWTYNGSLSTFWYWNTRDLNNVTQVSASNCDILFSSNQIPAKSVFDRHNAHKIDSEGNSYLEGNFDIHSPSHAQQVHPLFFTYDENGQHVYTWRTGYRRLDVNPAAQTDKTLYPAINPGDPGGYAFAVGPEDDAHVAWSWKRFATDEMPNVTAYRDYWGSDESNPANQPAPKGWKIASHKEIYSILPEMRVTGWAGDKALLFQANTSHEWTSGTGTGYYNEYTADKYVGLYDFQYVAGRIRLPEPGSTPGLKPILHDPAYLPVVYGIKHQGTDKAYLIKIEQRKSKEVLFTSSGQTFYFNYVVISRYPATRTDKILTNLNTDDPQDAMEITQTNLQDFDWSHPAAELYFPMQGYIDAGGGGGGPYLAEFGLSCIMRVTSWLGAREDGFNQTFYFRNSGVGSNTGSRNALGDPIRLIRDFNAH